jgi:hypothetical protein
LTCDTATRSSGPNHESTSSSARPIEPAIVFSCWDLKKSLASCVHVLPFFFQSSPSLD